MKLQFKDGVLEYSNGELHWKHDDQPFDVDKRAGAELLNTGYFEVVETSEPIGDETEPVIDPVELAKNEDATIMENPPRKKKESK